MRATQGASCAGCGRFPGWVTLGVPFTPISQPTAIPMYKLHCFAQSGNSFKVAVFLVGEMPTVADFSMCGYAFYPEEENGLDLMHRYPHVAAWVARIAPKW